MSKKNRLSRRKDNHEEAVRRETELKAKQEKKRLRRAANPPKKRKIPKNLVRGASRHPEKYEEAKAIMRERKARDAPKKMDLGDGPTGTARRAADTKSRAKDARRSVVDQRRKMDTE